MIKEDESDVIEFLCEYLKMFLGIYSFIVKYRFWIIKYRFWVKIESYDAVIFVIN